VIQVRVRRAPGSKAGARFAAGIIAAGVLAGCGVTPAESCEAGGLAPGRWRYSAVQESPVRATMEGVLLVSSANCGDFSGSLDVVMTDAQGQQRRIAGPLTGRTVSSSALRFDVDIEMLTRQHVGKLSADSVSGSWLSISGNATVSGTFRGKRESGS
jgi:hypothetical protein